jgi:hypothetical protein
MIDGDGCGDISVMGDCQEKQQLCCPPQIPCDLTWATNSLSYGTAMSGNLHLFAAAAPQQGHHKQNSYRPSCESHVQWRMPFRLRATGCWVPRHRAIADRYRHVLSVDHGRALGSRRSGLPLSADTSRTKWVKRFLLWQSEITTSFWFRNYRARCFLWSTNIPTYKRVRLSP